MAHFTKLAALGLATALSFAATSAHAEEVEATAFARILSKLEIQKTADLNFQNIVPGAAGGTVTIAAADASGGCSAGMTCTGTRTRAAFDLRGTNGETVLVSLPSASVVLEHATDTTAPSMTATLDLSTTSLALTSGPSAVGGTFHVGGTLMVGANQPEGSYSGDFNVEVRYQ